MAIKTLEEMTTSLSAILGERNDDDALAILEDLADTYNDFNSRLADSTDWKNKYDENDREWRKRYRDRFMNVNVVMPKGTTIIEPTKVDEDDETEEMVNFDDLFKED